MCKLKYMSCIFCFLCEGGNFNAMIYFSELPMEYKHESANKFGF